MNDMQNGMIEGRAGCIVPELLDGTNHVPWFEAGSTIFSKSGIQYLGVPGLINAKSIVATLIVQARTLCLNALPHSLCVPRGASCEGLGKP